MKSALLNILFKVSLTTSAILLSAVFAGAVFAGGAKAQSISKAKISISIQDAGIQQVLEAIEEKTEYTFHFKSTTIKKVDERISLNAKEETVADVLRAIAGKTGLKFRQVNENIIVHVPDKPPIIKQPQEAKKAPVLDRFIRGKVTNSEGEPLPGANILVLGTTNGAVSDVDGNYVIEVTDDARTLVISFIGYQTQQIDIAGRSTIDIVLEVDAKTLNEIVVSTGYWEVDQKENTGNISKVSAKEIEGQPVSNVLQSIQGRMAGVSVQQVTGVPGGGFTISIRGQNSLRPEGNEPLYLIDGIPFPSIPLSDGLVSAVKVNVNPLASINPNDIESIEVLKDADATAIYGSRGANGVVLVTTKQGKGNQSRVDLTFSRGIGRAVERIDLLNSEQYLTMRQEAIENSGVSELPQATLDRAFPDVYVWEADRFTDWQEELIGGTAQQTNANFSLSGGSGNTNFTLAGGYFNETTVFPGDNDFERLSGRISMNHLSADEKLEVRILTSYTTSSSELPFSDLTSAAVTLAPNAPELYDESGNLNWENGTWENPLADLERRSEDVTDNLVTDVTLSYEVVKGLRLKTSLGYNTMTLTSSRTEPLSALNPADITPNTTAASYLRDGTVKTWIMEPQLEYQRAIAKGKLTVLAGATFQNTERETERLRLTGFSNDAFLLNPRAAQDVEVQAADYSEYRYNALFARINYTWNEKYIINVTGRRDGSSRFGPGNQFGNFGAVGGAWIFSKESFMANNLPFINFGKFRGSYGTTGSDQVGDYEFSDTYSLTQEPYGNVSGLEVTRLANENFSWETVKKLEFGVELGLFQDRVFTSVSWYRNRATDQLVGRPLSNVTGAGFTQFNLPATVENRGWEFVLNTTTIRTRNFTWSTGINFTIPNNELLEFDDIEAFPSFAATWEVGKPIWNGSNKFLEFRGINPETGIYDFEDANEDGVIDNADRQKFIELGQEYFGGVENRLRFKSFELNFHLQFVKQNGFDIYERFTAPGTESNQPAELVSRWQRPGDIGGFQRYDRSGPAIAAYTDYTRGSDANIVNTSFIRLRNVSLSYTIPDKYISRLRINTLRVFADAQNLWTTTGYTGFNPENGNLTLPALQVFTGGVQITL
ncbi:MAG: SusC/RagA family TonB-linked outer membrane protein [Cytophagales bacterium]|nr:SusC/RagA family TonB-linked outer membrane protein [Cytophagales bacterium]